MWSVNPDTFTDHDLLPSCVTDLAEAQENHEASENVEEVCSHAEGEQ
jgi:hypothetical protein